MLQENLTIVVSLGNFTRQESIFLLGVDIVNQTFLGLKIKGYRIIFIGKPLFEGRLLDRDIHISEIDVPEDSSWAGKKLAELKIGNRFGVHVSSILRGAQRLNIPTGNTVIFPGDRIQAIGNDEQLNQFGNALRSELIAEDPEIEKRQMHLRKMILNNDSEFIGKTLKDSGIRDRYNCMVVGVEEG